MKCYMGYPIWASPPLKPKISFSKIMCSVSLQLYHPLGNRTAGPDSTARISSAPTLTVKLHPDLDLGWREAGAILGGTSSGVTHCGDGSMYH
jgi:hypothetical protein